MRKLPLFADAAGPDANIHHFIGAAAVCTVTRAQAVRLFAWSYARRFARADPDNQHAVLNGWLWGRFGATAGDMGREARALAGVNW